jgi:hypothetical protein
VDAFIKPEAATRRAPEKHPIHTEVTQCPIRNLIINKNGEDEEHILQQDME